MSLRYMHGPSPRLKSAPSPLLVDETTQAPVGVPFLEGGGGGNPRLRCYEGR